MVSSTLNPQAITKNTLASLSSFGNFMTGGTVSSSSGVANAANKIVSFNRPEVSPISSNINSLISNISTNILNQVDNSIKNTTNFLKNDSENKVNELRNDIYSKINELQSNLNVLQKDLQVKTQDVSTQIVQQQQTQSQTPVSGFQEVVNNIQVQITNVLDNTLKSFSKDYQEKIKGFDDARPNNVLTKFLDLYRNAIGFVNFFGDRKNIKTIETNLKALRKIFEESFEVALVLRQTIVKIVNQLSNLPTASPNSGGLNLDIDVPGGRLRQAGGQSVRNVGRAVKFGGIAGAGLLGLGGLGMATSGMSRAKEYQESLLSQGISSGEGDQYVPDNIVESFSSIVDRFVTAVNSLISGAKKSPGGGGGGSSGGTPSSSPFPRESSGSNPPPMGQVTGSQAEKENQMFDYLKQNYGENVAYGMLANAMRESGYRTNAPEGGFQGMFQWDKTRWNNLSKWAKSQGLDPMDNSTQIRYAIVESEQLGTLKRMKSAKTPEEAASIFYNEFERAAFSKPIVGSAYTPDNPHEVKNRGFLRDIMSRQQKRKPGSSTITQQPIQAKVTPAPTQTQAIQARAQSISQPAQQVPQTISLSPTVIDASGGGQQQGGGGVQTIPSQPPGAGPEVPFLPTTNPDNFLTMYSRIVYNIVDG